MADVTSMHAEDLSTRPSWETTEHDAIVAETRRLYWSSRWIGPTGSFLASLIVVAVLWNELSHQRLVLWLAASTLLCVAMAIGFCVPDPRGGTARSGLSRVTELAHFGIGSAYGSLLWLSKDICDSPVAVWTILAAMFAISAGVATGLSGLSRLSLMTMAPMWAIASAGLLRAGEWITAIGVILFSAIITIDQHRTTALWQELIVLRIAERRQAEQNGWAATHDDLTGLLNRAGVMGKLDDQRSATTGMFIDLDHFKQVNDRFGHAVGDRVLHDAARRIETTVRRGDALARIGGDEFFIAFDRKLTDEQAHRVGSAIIEVLEEPFAIDGAGEVLISASVGFTSVSFGQVDSSRLIVEADHAMLHAKRRGRRQVAPFTPRLEAELEARAGLESAFRKAIRTNGISCDAQPGFDLNTGRVVGVELLARWQLPGGAQVPPTVFVPLAEEVGLIDELTDHMLDLAGRCLTDWATVPQLAEARVAVNVSPVQIAKGNLLESVAAAIERHRIPQHRLSLELTESATLSGVATTAELFDDLRQLGVTIAIDDFGTGYSSLGHLLQLPITAVKIDRSLIAGLGTEPRQQAVMVAIRDLARVLGQVIIAEGVEHPRQIEALRSIGIQLGQGFGLMRPVPVDELIDHIQLLSWPELVADSSLDADLQNSRNS